ncbi:hypothetical protein [Streptomyces sp. NPDC017202]|uniref:hypothetical protein n=1 Tax=Streptomyces sp. NPDC017202 TaxID=3364981 RepID=UPI0037B2657D
MAEQGGGDGPEAHTRRSALDDYAELTGPGTGDERTPSATAKGRPVPDDGAPPSPVPAPPEPPASFPGTDDIARVRREFGALLGEFRRTAVLVPVGEDEAPLAADHGGIRWLYAFSDESALARFAIARGETAREWPYRRVLGARLLDAGVGATGVPCGVALDVGGEGNGVLFPPVAGIVPDAVAVDVRAAHGEEPR